MSKAGKAKAIEALKAAPQQSLIDEFTGSNEVRFATQAWLKMLHRNPKSLQNGFVFWVVTQSYKETGENWPMILEAAAKRVWSNNRKAREAAQKLEALKVSQTANEELMKLQAEQEQAENES